MLVKFSVVFSVVVLLLELWTPQEGNEDPHTPTHLLIVTVELKFGRIISHSDGDHVEWVDVNRE